MPKLIVSAFPGTGKTYLAEKYGFQDSDSSKFSWITIENDNPSVYSIPTKIRNPDFPKNYIEHIKNSDADVIFVSTHKEVRDALKAEELPYILIYPERSCMVEYKDRYLKRGSPMWFRELLVSMWNDWIDELEAEDYPKKLVLKPGEYLSNHVHVHKFQS